MISAKYNPLPQKKTNKQTNKQKANKTKQNNKQTNAKTKNMWGFVFPKCCSHQGYWRIIFWEKNLKLEEFSLWIDDEQKIWKGGIFTLLCERLLGRKVKRKKKEGKNSRLPIHSKAHSLDHIWGWMTLCARQVILHYLDNSFLTFV